MRVIPPLEITDARLISSTVIESSPSLYNGATAYAVDNTVSVAGSAGLITIYRSLQGSNTGNSPAISPDWWVNIGTTYQTYSGSTTYALGDRVINDTTHLIYESLSAVNVGNALSNTASWLLIGPTNKWAMFDTLRNTATIAPNSISVVVNPNSRIDSLALLGLIADTVTLDVSRLGASIYSKTVNLVKRDVFDWYDYFFKEFISNTSMADFDVPPYLDDSIAITISRATGDVQCGALVLGQQVYLGDVEYEAESDVLNFSSVTRDEFGNSSLIPRRNVPKTIQTIWCNKDRVNTIRYLRDSLNATPAVWSGLDDDNDDYFESLLILGIYKRFTINLKYPQNALISLELEEI